MAFELTEGSKVAVIGGGPAGAFFAYFLLKLGRIVDLGIQLDIYEPRDFAAPGPRGCNMCAGIISESLIQLLAAEGINLPPTVVQRGIDSYVLHTSVGKTKIKTLVDEKRIATVFRGAGPRGLTEAGWRSFDGLLLELAIDKGAHWRQEKVATVRWNGTRPEVVGAGGAGQKYDLIISAVGVNRDFGLFKDMGLKYKPPRTAKSHVREFLFGQKRIAESLGDNIHIFFLDLPGLEYAAMIPKGDYVTLCLIGEGVDGALVDTFLSTRQVKACFPKDIDLTGACRCSPLINLRAAVEPFADRIVFIGDCGASRLFKDGIGAAYRMAKAASTAAVFQGLSESDWRRHYLPTYRQVEADNRIGRIIFGVNAQIKKRRLALKGLVRMVEREQAVPYSPRRLSGVLWDTFTGGAFYTDIFNRTLHPFFLGRYLWETMAALWPPGRASKNERDVG